MLYHKKNTEAELLQGCREKHRLAQQYLYQRYFGRLIGIPMRYCGNREEATEVLNMAFLKIFEGIHQYQQTGSFGGWMARIVFHTTIDFVRSKIAYRRVLDYEPTADHPVDNEALQGLLAEDLFKLIQLLPDTARTIFCLHVVEGYKHQEIARLLDIDEGTSRWHLSKARKTLQSLIKSHYPSTYSTIAA